MPRLSRLLLLVLVCAVPSTASAQDRSRTGRARLELALDLGYGGGSDGGYVEIGADLRLSAPFGLGVVLRTGLATNGFSNALAADLGIAYRLDLIQEEHLGVQVGAAVGPSVASGPFDQGEVLAYGGWAMIHLDFWYRNLLIGVGLSGHAMVGERHAQPTGRDTPILTLAPMIRFGGEWGL